MLPLLREISRLLGRWPLALVAVLSIAGLVLLPGLGSTGLWEPQERQFADRVTPPEANPAEVLASTKPPAVIPGSEDACVRAAPKDAAARSLTSRAAQLGRNTLGDDDVGRRLPFALMGLLTVLATAGIAMRLAGARAGIIGGVVVLSMPLLTFQSRMLTSEIGTACGASLLVYGLVAISRPTRRLGASRHIVIAVVDGAISVAALTLGSTLGFYGGGALLGLVVPIGAFAAAGGLGLPMFGAGFKLRTILPHVPSMIAAVVAASIIGLLAYQLFELKTPVPGMMPPARQVLGNAIVPEACWSWALGGLWRADDDLRMIFDSTFEQIAYGTFPWGVLAPIAMAMLLRSDDRDHRSAGALALAWAGTAWIAGEIFQRKVGFTLYAGFPALAIAVGVWFDAVLTRRAHGDPEASPEHNHGLLLLGLFALLAIVVLAKDIQSFTERITSLTIGSDSIPYPKESRLLLIPTKLWILKLGALIGLGVAVTLGLPVRFLLRPGVWRRLLASFAPAIVIATTVALAAFWSLVWLPRLSIHLSSKAMFDTYRELRRPGDQLVIMGDLGEAARAYSDTKPEIVTGRDKVVAALGRSERVFAVAPQTELCTLHREVGGKPYYVIDDRNTRSLLLSNRVDGTADRNPLATAIVHEEPTTIRQRPKGKVVWDNRIQLLGWDIPPTMNRGAKVQLRVYYKILTPVGGSWKSLMHFDGPLRFNGDHEPISGRCPTSTWQAGDFIIDTHTVTAGGSAFPAAKYDLWIGFFTGSAPNWKNMAVSEAPGDMRDAADRVKILSVLLD